MIPRTPQTADLLVLSLIGVGLVAILLAIIAGLFMARNNNALPNWAENVLVSIATGTTLKLGDVLSALVALATGRQMEGAVQKLGQPIEEVIRPSQASAVPPTVSAADHQEQV